MTGNDLRDQLPEDWSGFCVLEKLILEHNNIQNNHIFEYLSRIPRLRHVSLAYNFLCSVPSDVLRDDGYRFLETMDVAYNYFGRESDLEALIYLPRLLVVLLYGNPLLGPTGEDALKIYIEELCNAALDARAGTEQKDIDVRCPFS